MASSSGSQLLTPPSWLDKNLIETALRSADPDPTLVILSIDIKMANLVGENYTSDMFRVSIETERSPDHHRETRSLIVKCQPSGGMREKVIVESKVFHIEIDIITRILPQMFTILEHFAPNMFTPFSAQCFHHCVEPMQCIVLEDLSPLGFKLAERWQGLDLPHSLFVIKSIARLHAASAALFEKDPSSMERYFELYWSDSVKESFGGMVKQSIRSVVALIDQWPEYKHKYSEKLMKLSETCYDTLIELNKCKVDAFNVLLHGDLWVNNIMFRYNGDQLEDLRFIDYQLSRFASPAIDLQYFLHTSITEDVFNEHLDSLVNEYHSTLTATLTLLKCKKTITLEQLKKDLDGHVMHAFYAVVTILPVVMAPTKDVFNFESSLSEKEHATSSNPQIYASPTYVKSLKKLLPIFESKGIF